MYCLCCEKKIRGIKEDGDYQNWQRKYHKNCWKERDMYYNLYLKILKIQNYNPTTLELYRQKSCLD